ncbi:MAG: UDP-N-acetylmuramoyl-L-alanine--D-glutamate ligase, partial [Egibacteraceae bacterium]
GGRRGMTPPRRPLVVGLGISGVAVTRALLDRGHDVRVADARSDPALAGRADPLVQAGAQVRLGSMDECLLDGRDLVVASPGVPPYAPLLVAALARGLPVWSEPELAWRLSGEHVRLVAVTGTNGKTTTTELAAACLGAPAAGNIGTPLVELLGGSPPPLVVAELSSFQLHFTHTLRPDVAVLLNVAGDHLDWHGTIQAYRAAKARVWASQRPGDVVVVGDDGGALQTVTAHPPPGAVMRVGTAAPACPGVGVRDGVIVWQPPEGEAVPVVDVARLALVGPHNLANVCAAVAAAVCAGADPARLAPVLASFVAGPHRVERIAAINGVTWVNDSKATNPHAAAAALRSFGSVVWIAGGLDKDLDFDALADLVRERVRAAVTIGACGPRVASVARRAGVQTVEAGTLDVAVGIAARLARPGDTVLLAPAAASMDQFTDYAARGQAFRQLVTALRERGTTELDGGGLA